MKTKIGCDSFAKPYLVLGQEFAHLLSPLPERREELDANLAIPGHTVKVYKTEHPVLVTLKLNDTYICREVSAVVVPQAQQMVPLLGNAWERSVSSDRSRIQQKLLNEFSDIFVENSLQVSMADLPEVDLGYELNKKAEPLPYRLNPASKIDFQQIHYAALDSGFVREVPHHLVSDKLTPMPPVLPKKSDSSKRFCLNGSNLKLITKKRKVHLDGLHSLKSIERSEAKLSFDIAGFFHQIPVKEEQAIRQCYEFQGKLYYVTSVIMGAVNGSAVADDILYDFLCSIPSISNEFTQYVDDALINVYSLSDAELKGRELLESCRKKRIQLNAFKFIISSKSIKFLNWTIRPSHMVPGNKYMDILKKGVTSIADAASLMFSLNYFVKAVPNLQILLNKVRKEVEKTGGIKSTKKCPVDILTTLEKAITLVKSAEITLIDPKEPLYLHTDWSREGTGVVISQLDVNGNPKPYLVHHVHHNKIQSSLPAPLGELASVVMTLNSLWKHLKGFKLILTTDALAVKKAVDNILDANISRYATYLLSVILDYDISFHYTKGQDNPADVLSRIVGGSLNECISPVIKSISMSEDSREPTTGNDTSLIAKTPSAANNDSQNNIVDTSANSEDDYKKEKIQLGQALHQMGHYGFQRTLALKNKLAVSLEDEYLREGIARCRKCLFADSLEVKIHHGRLKFLPVARMQWVLDAGVIDNHHFIVAFDPYSKLVFAKTIKDLTALSGALFIILLKATYPQTKILFADNGSTFATSSVLNPYVLEIMSKLDIKMSASLAYHHQANAHAESAIAQIKKKWRADSQLLTFDLFLKNYTETYNKYFNPTIKCAPKDVKSGSLKEVKQEKEIKNHSNIYVGEKLFRLKKPLPSVGYSFKRKPLKTEELAEIIADVVTVVNWSGKLVHVTGSTGATSLPSELLRKPRIPLIESEEVTFMFELAEFLTEQAPQLDF